ncbi:hypothetical protein MKJ04_15565 [Pontibacter sp. E15-1]|uniref:tetratricopeptide repeat protein n=1 Tax=Pontibacter sp. E15-1 TaxID=2919918 RepID=UPI001F4FC91A|nr:hypothetical protein [Pontibacter sp. E15-1]MCJ8166265.1 hypothetical protein [Pontibacter sp. E15-1]
MRKCIVVAVGFLMSLSACKTPQTNSNTQQLPPTPALTMADVLPVTQPTTPEAKAAQEAFIQEHVDRFKSRALASAYYVLQGQRTFKEEKTDSATYFFSRAYLMDSTNNDVYWGYGLLYGQQQEYDKALFALYHALKSDPGNPRLLNDVATSHLSRFYVNSNPEDLLQSKKLLEQAVQQSPEEADLYYKLAISSYYLREYESAWGYLHKSQTYDASVGDEAFISALLEKHPDPAGKYPTPPAP